MKKYKIGYTQGTYDLFHVGHLNLLKHAKEQCDYLIVGVNDDDLVYNYKNKRVNVTAHDRARIVNAIKYVDKVYVVNSLDKKEILKYINFDAIFIGDDWKGNSRWNDTIKEMENLGKSVVFLPHTDGISTTKLTKSIRESGVSA